MEKKIKNKIKEWQTKATTMLFMIDSLKEKDAFQQAANASIRHSQLLECIDELKDLIATHNHSKTN